VNEVGRLRMIGNGLNKIQALSTLCELLATTEELGTYGRKPQDEGNYKVEFRGRVDSWIVVE
jgi:hypothetical protein